MPSEITISIRIDRDIKRRLQLHAVNRNLSLRILTDGILEDWLNQQEVLIVAPQDQRSRQSA